MAFASKAREREYNRNYRRKNLTSLRQKERVYTATRKKEKRAYDIAYYAKNRAKLLEQARLYKIANRDKVLASTREWAKKYPARAKESYWKNDLKSQFGMTPDEYYRLLDSQGGVCAICGQPPNGRRLGIDHSHSRDTIRGLLCFSCNAGLGNLRERIERFQKAIEYLKNPPAVVFWGERKIRRSRREKWSTS